MIRIWSQTPAGSQRTQSQPIRPNRAGATFKIPAAASITRRLSELTHHALLAWLKYRHLTWPRTPNRHVLITRVSALGTGPVTASHLDRLLRTDTPLEHIRRDRILQEALATGADSLHLALVFNIDHTTATEYANSARRILDSELDQPHHDG